MVSSETIAAIVGPVLVALALSEARHLKIWSEPSPQVVYLNGLLLLAAGLAIIRVHNLWVWGWPAMITAIGWLAAAAGLYRMFAPHAPQAKAKLPTYVGLGVLAAVGLVLAFYGWRTGAA